MAKIKLADLAGEDTTVDLFGNDYRVLAVTRSVQKKLEEAQPTLENIDSEEDSDKVVEILAGTLDAILAPVKQDVPSAHDALVDAWQDDKLSLTQLGALFERAQEASVARPTT